MARWSRVSCRGIGIFRVIGTYPLLCGDFPRLVTMMQALK
jgi:hypothetical protein